MKQILTVVFLLFTSIGYSQIINYFITDYKNSMLLLLDENQNSNVLYNSYGRILKTGNQQTFLQTSYQGQEYDKNLDLYFFPKRIYTAKKMRFQQPDPLSQYASPYLFVAADPVNLVDRDGQKGKPLVLYQEDFDFPDRMEVGISKLKENVSDAYYHPMSSIVDGSIGEIPEWNGSVFFIGHMGTEEDEHLVIEKSRKAFRDMNPKMGSVIHDIPKRETYWTCDGKEMGRLLREFSESRSVPIKSVIAGGCRGAVAAKEMREGFYQQSKTYGYKGRKAEFMGVKKQKTFWSGRQHKFYRAPHEPKERMTYNIGEKESVSSFVTHDELPGFMSGEVPSRVTADLEFFPLKY